MEPLTSLQKAQYSLRRYLLKYYKEGAGASLKKSQRFYDIVNQTDPEVLFAHLKEETILQKILNDDISKKPPDDAVFNRIRTVLEGNLHHEAELERNRNAIPGDWADEDLFEYHAELKDINERIGSSPENLPELREIDHDPKGIDNTPENRAAAAHDLGTKSERGPLKYSDTNTLNPRLRAAETVLLNMPDRERIKAIEMDPERPSFIAFQEGQRINEELGMEPYERRQMRDKRGTNLTTSITYDQNATPELVEATDIESKQLLRKQRRAAAAGAAAGLAGIGWLGTGASIAETAVRADIATTTNNPVDYLQFGLSGISNLADFAGPLGEIISTPADAINVGIDTYRDPNRKDATTESLSQGSQYSMPTDTAAPNPQEIGEKLGGVVEGAKQQVDQTMGAFGNLWEKLQKGAQYINLSGYSGL